jgi:PKD repeat protein
MKKLFILVFLCICFSLSYGQQLLKGETYFDTDPGVGNGTAFTFTAADSIDMPVAVPTGTLTAGFHRLYVRTQGTDGKWGHSSDKLVYIIDTSAPTAPSTSAPVAALEYFYDAVDPGPGNGALLNPFTPLDSISVYDSVIAVDPSFGFNLSVGTHTLNIRAKDLNGKWGHTKSVAFIVCDQPAVSAYTYSVSGTTVTFTNNSTNSFGTQWIFGDGATSTATTSTVQHTYNNGGTLNVCMIAYSGCGNDTSCSLVSLNCVSPAANFTSSVSNLTATFTNTSSGAATSSWNFGDGQTSTLANPSHVYQASGTYTVCLTANNGCGSSTICFPVTVTCVAPVSNFSVSITGLTATITNNSTNAFNFSWNFGDGSGLNNVDYNPVHQFTAPGTYIIKLTVGNGCGVNIYQISVTISCVPPSADFSFITDGLQMEIDNSSLNGNTWSWNFGDATTSPFKNPPIHTFPSTGTYTVCLVATNTCGSDTVCNVVSVCTDPTAQFTYSPSGTTVNFSNTSTNGTTYLWNFGNGLITNVASPSHTYTSSGSKTVCLKATNSCGTDSICQTLQLFCFSGTPEICMVSVDTASTHNIVFWDTTGLEGVDTFLVQREITLNNYSTVGKVAYGATPEYHDMAANPNGNTFRYKLGAIDTCGVTADTISYYHNTVYIQQTNGTFNWAGTEYKIENVPNPVNYYVLERDSLSNGIWDSINSCPGTQFVLTDNNWANQAYARWRIRTIWTISCDALIPAAPGGNNNVFASITKSRSNIQNNRAITAGEKEMGLRDFSLYPNPAKNQFTIQLNALSKNMTIEILDLSGRIVQHEKINSGGIIFSINTQDLSNGIYFVRVNADGVKIVKKLVIEK